MRVLSFDIGIRHLAFAEVECDTNAAVNVSSCAEPKQHWLKLHRWEVIDLGPGLKGASVPGAVVCALEARFLWVDTARLDAVLIENQPAFKNPVMKSVQVAVHTFFAMLKHCMPDMVGEIRLMSATRKTLVSVAPTPPPLADAPSPASAGAPTASTIYRDRKAAAVRLCAHYVRDVLRDDIHATTLQDSKKRDDLSDCFMQAMCFLQQHCGVRAVRSPAQM